jgi:hypothetical protein
MISFDRIAASTNRPMFQHAIHVPMLATLFIASLLGTTRAYADRCGNLVSLQLENTRITSAETVTPGMQPNPPDVPLAVLKDLPSFCRVAAEIQPAKD